MDDGSQINLKNKIKINNINDRYFNIDSKPTPKSNNNLNDKNIVFNEINTDEDLEIELDAVSQKIPIENFAINNNKEEKFIKLENTNKILPIQRKKRSKIHRHKSYDNLHDNNNTNVKSNTNNNINYNKINNQKRSIPNIKITNDNLRRDFSMQNENFNNKTEYDIFKDINNLQYENNNNKKNTIDAKNNKVSYFQNYNENIDINKDNNEIEETINNENKNNFGISNLINLKAAHNKNYYYINEFQNLMNKNGTLEKNNKDINNSNNEEYQKEESKYIDDESLVQKIEDKLKNKFEKNEFDEYINRTPNIRNSSINYFENDIREHDEFKSKSPNANDIIFKPTNIINLGKNKEEKYSDSSKDKNQNTKLINQIKKLKEENKSLKAKNEKLSQKIFQIEKEQKKKNNTEISLLQRIKKLENQINQKNMIISKLSNRQNYNNIKRIKIISFFIRNKNNNIQNKNFKNLKMKCVENIRYFPEYMKDSIYEKLDMNISNEEENFEKENEGGEFEEDEDIKIINNENEDSEIEDETDKKTINKGRIRSLKKNKSNKIFSNLTNKVKNKYKYKHSSSISNNNTININKIYYKNESYHHSIPVSNKKKQKNSGKKSIYEYFEKSSNNDKDSIESNKIRNNIISKKNSQNKYNQNYNINFYKNNCYGNNFISLFQNEESNNKQNNNIIKENINNKKEKHQTSLIMSVLNDNLLGNMNFNIANTKIKDNNSKNKDSKKAYK